MMERAALRLATTAVLLNGGNGNPWPTMADEFVYDSRMDDIVDTVPIERKPIVVLRTDRDRFSFQNAVVTGRTISLLIEISCVTSVMDKATGKPRIKWPKTDASLEAMLDLLEWQVYIALYGYGVWAQWYKGLGYGSLVDQVSTPRYSPPERGQVRLAVRTLEHVMRAPIECVPRPLHENDPEEPPMLSPHYEKIVKDILQYGSGDFKTSVEQTYAIMQARGRYTRPRYPAFKRVWATLPELEIAADIKLPQRVYATPLPVVTQPPEVTNPTVT